MANKSAEYANNNSEEIKISSIIKIQTLIRGYLVRKWYRELQEVYTAVVTEIQKDSGEDVIWRRCMCKPQILKSSQRKQQAYQKYDCSESQNKDKTGKHFSSKLNLGQTTNEKEAFTQSPRSLSCCHSEESGGGHKDSLNESCGKSVKSVDVQTDHEEIVEDLCTVGAEGKDDLFSSVETQTSMIEGRQEGENHMPKTNKIAESQEDCFAQNVLNDNILDVLPDNIKPKDEHNELHLNLDNQRFDTDDESSHKLPIETGGWNLPDDERTVIKDFDQEDENSDKFSIKGSVHSERSHQSSAQSRTEIKERADSERSRSLPGSARSDRSETAEATDNKFEVINDRGQTYRSESHGGSDLYVFPLSSSAIPDKKGSRNLTSPVPRGRRAEKQKILSQDTSTLTNVTSVWDSVNSVRDSYTSHNLEVPSTLPSDPEQLHSLRKNIAMELLWVQQAINSRKNYLKLKEQM